MTTEPPPPPPAPAPTVRKKFAPWIIPAIVAVGLFILVALVAIPAAILIPTVGKVRQTARRTVDGAHVRQIVQASLVYAVEHDGRLPAVSLPSDGGLMSAREPATIHLVATALARRGGLNDATFWFSLEDRAASRTATGASTASLIGADGTPDPAFISRKALAWDYATGLTLHHSPNTPVAWTRGLRRDGTWDPEGGVYGAAGGHIAFLGGNVHFFHDLREAPLSTPDGRPTHDILSALPPGTRVVGAGPGTLHGAAGGAP